MDSVSTKNAPQNDKNEVIVKSLGLKISTTTAKLVPHTLFASVLSSSLYSYPNLKVWSSCVAFFGLNCKLTKRASTK